MKSERIVTIPLEEYLQLCEMRNSLLEENKDKILYYNYNNNCWKLIASEEFKSNLEKDLIPKMKKVDEFLEERSDLRYDLKNYQDKSLNYFISTVILSAVSLFLIIKYIF